MRYREIRDFQSRTVAVLRHVSTELKLHVPYLVDVKPRENSFEGQVLSYLIEVHGSEKAPTVEATIASLHV